MKVGRPARLPREGLARLGPTAILLAVAVALAWKERGSILGIHWLPYLVLCGLLLASLLAAGGVLRPPRLSLAGIAGLVGAGVWAAVTIAWTAAPAAARDEAFLRVFYALALAAPLLTLRTAAHRLAATSLVVLSLGTIAAIAGLELAFGGHPLDRYSEGRLYFPITYENAQAALFLLAFWPAVAIAARTRSSPLLRAAALSSASGCAAGTLLAQSKGAALGLLVSTVVYFALSPLRLRTLVPAALALAPVAVAFFPLTEPYRADEAHLVDAIRGTGVALLAVMGAAAALGLAYALLDRRTRLSARTVRAAGVAVAALLTAAALAGSAAFLATTGDPGTFLSDRWHEFTAGAGSESGSTHFTSLGSQRWDYWTVAVDAFKQHPVGGVGSRGFGALYALEGSSIEQPARGHSLLADSLAEEGLVGTALLLLGLGPLLFVAARRGRRAAGAAALLAASTGWLAQACVDWTWTFPSLGIPFFILLGIAAASEAPLPAPRRPAALLAGATVVVALLATLPWMSSRLVDRALRDPTGAASDLRWAKRIDPLTVTPYVAQWRLAPDFSGKIFALHGAVEREPRNAALHFFLGLTFEDAKAKPAARTELAEAHRLAPRNVEFAAALQRVSG